MLWTTDKHYPNDPFENESQLESAVVEVSKELFGTDRIYIDVKKRIGTKTKNIPDGYRAPLLRYQQETEKMQNVWTKRCRNERFMRYWQAMADRNLRRQRLVLYISRKISPTAWRRCSPCSGICKWPR